MHSVLVIGNAGGTTARALAAEYPGIDIDAVELDPVVTQLARQYMGLDAIPNLHVITADGREYLETTAKRYDMIVVDAYRTEFIPFYLATQEFFSLMRAHLNPGGGDRAQRRARPRQQSAGRRDRRDGRHRVSAGVGVAGVALQRAGRGPRRPRYRHTSLAGRLSALPESVQVLGPLVVQQAYTVAPPSQDPLTDDRAPVEWLTDRGRPRLHRRRRHARRTPACRLRREPSNVISGHRKCCVAQQSTHGRMLQSGH